MQQRQRYKGRLWVRQERNGWLTKVQLPLTDGMNILEAWEDGEPDRVAELVADHGVFYLGEVIRIVGLRSNGGGQIRLSIFVSVVS